MLETKRRSANLIGCKDKGSFPTRAVSSGRAGRRSACEWYMDFGNPEPAVIFFEGSLKRVLRLVL